MQNIREALAAGSQEMFTGLNSPPLTEDFKGGYQFRVNGEPFALVRWEVPQNSASAKTSEGLWSFKLASARSRVIAIELTTTATSQPGQPVALFTPALWSARGELETTNSNQRFVWKPRGNQKLWLSGAGSRALVNFKPKVKAGQVLTVVEVEAAAFSLVEFPLLVVVGCYLLGGGSKS